MFKSRCLVLCIISQRVVDMIGLEGRIQIKDGDYALTSEMKNYFVQSCTFLLKRLKQKCNEADNAGKIPRRISVVSLKDTQQFLEARINKQALELWKERLQSKKRFKKTYKKSQM